MAEVLFVAGLGYGDEGKGSIVDYLVREYNAGTVVRYNGGSQAGHNVVTLEGISHCFAQFSSGTLVKGTKTYLSKYMLIDPISIDIENSVLIEKGITDAKEHLIIDGNCIVITPFHKILNRMLEISRGDVRHGSCGKGVGQAMADWEMYGKLVLFADDMKNKSVVQQKLDLTWRIKLDLAEQLVDNQPNNKQLEEYFIQLKQSNYVERLIDEYYTFALSSDIRVKGNQFLKEELNAKGCVIFEGAQGALLDAEYGFYPYVTRTKTTFENAEKLISECEYSGQITQIGVIRAYATRHGAGVFVTENGWLAKRIPDVHNEQNEWQEDFRLGWFDLVIAKYALEMLGGVDYIALTNFDRLQDLNKVKIPICMSYNYDCSILNNIILHKNTIMDRIPLTKGLNECSPNYLEVYIDDYIQFIEKELDTEISIVSVGQTAKDKIQRKSSILDSKI